jgi:class 3 adenylate cyclase
MPQTARKGAWIEWQGGEPVLVKQTCCIGRAETNQVVLPSENVSRRHAVINAEGPGAFHVLDLGSNNGTFVNGRRITQPTLLKDGDVVDIGPFQLRFCQRTPHRPRPSASPAENTEPTVAVVSSAPYWLLLADLTSSTALSRRIKPEDLPTITGEWFHQCRAVIERNGGAIDTCLGDGFLAYWRNSQTAADQVAATLSELKALRDASLPFRVAVHYGEAFSGGSMASGVERFFGPQVNFVYKLERLASALSASCLLSPSAHYMLQCKLDTAPLGDHEVPGFPGTFSFHGF